MEVYDILFFDWVLLCHSNFFPHFYPEIKGIAAPQLFGYNKKAHLTHFLLYCNVTRSVSKMTEIEGRGGNRWDKPKKAEKSRDCGGGKF